jgi:hypothetical protein
MTQQLSHLTRDHSEFGACASRGRGGAAHAWGAWGESPQNSSSNSSGAAQSDVQRTFQQNSSGTSPKAPFARASSMELAL